MVADLKRARPSPAVPVKRGRKPISPHVSADSTEAWVEKQSKEAETFSDPMSGPNTEAYDDYDEEGEDEDVLRSTRSREISERKRRTNAIADTYIQEIAQKSLKEDIQSGCYKIEDQSARYIVDQAESQRIISTPREYQTELFERAKDKNIIAVLDTGRRILRLMKPC